MGYVVYGGEKKRRWDGRDKGKNGTKEEGKKIEISKKKNSNRFKSTMFAARPCRGWRAWWPQPPSGVETVAEASSPQATSALQANKAWRWFTDGIQARIPRFSTQLPNRKVKRAADQWTGRGLQSGLSLPGLSSSAHSGLFADLEGASNSTSLNLVFENRNMALFPSKRTSLCRRRRDRTPHHSPSSLE